jgi:hypothetical protein
MTIPALPDAPALGDSPEVFNTKAFAFVAALDDWGTAVNAVAAEVDADATAADADAATATTQAGIATTKASEAAASALDANSAELGAQAAQTAAELAATNAAASYDSFDDRYLGAKSSDPSVDNDGGALIIGALYFNTTDQKMKVYATLGWKDAGSAVNGSSRRQTFTATAGQTSFTVTDGYDANFADVYLNGVKLVNGTDVTVSSGTAVVLASGAAAGDVLDVVAYGAFEVADTYTQSQVDAFAVKLTGDQTIAGVKTFSSAPVMGVSGLTGDIAAARITSALNASGSAPIYACRAWVNFNGNGTVAIRGSGNVSSITDNGTGDYTVNFTNAMPDINYSTCFGSSHTWNSTNGDQGWANLRSNNGGTSPQQTGSVRIWTSSKHSGLGGAVDNEQVNVSVHR